MVSYWTDGYEDIVAEDLTEDDFAKKNYERKQVIGDEVVEKEAPVYKICTSELWDIVIPIEEELGKKLEEEGVPCENGIFRADMKVEILNDGPVTIILNKS